MAISTFTIHRRSQERPYKPEWRRLGQVQEPGDLGRVRGGTTSDTAAAGVLEKFHDGGTGSRVFRDRVQG